MVTAATIATTRVRTCGGRARTTRAVVDGSWGNNNPGEPQRLMIKSGSPARATTRAAHVALCDVVLLIFLSTKQNNNNKTTHVHIIQYFPYPDSMLLYDTCCTYVLPHSHPEPPRFLSPATLPTPTRRRYSEQKEVGFWGKRLGEIFNFGKETWRSRRAKQFGDMLWHLVGCFGKERSGNSPWENFNRKKCHFREGGGVVLTHGPSDHYRTHLSGRHPLVSDTVPFGV